jgi:hypothetical protein
MGFVEIGLMIAIIILASSLAKFLFGGGHRQHRQEGRAGQATSTEAARLHFKERAEARELYERLVREKLNVIRDAITMGYSEVELNKLDKRLAELIGEEELKKLIAQTPEAPIASADLMDTDLMKEVDALRKQRESS